MPGGVTSGHTLPSHTAIKTKLKLSFQCPVEQKCQCYISFNHFHTHEMTTFNLVDEVKLWSMLWFHLSSYEAAEQRMLDGDGGPGGLGSEPNTYLTMTTSDKSFLTPFFLGSYSAIIGRNCGFWNNTDLRWDKVHENGSIRGPSSCRQQQIPMLYLRILDWFVSIALRRRHSSCQEAVAWSSQVATPRCRRRRDATRHSLQLRPPACSALIVPGNMPPFTNIHAQDLQPTTNSLIWII